jgi:hypothetical protein
MPNSFSAKRPKMHPKFLTDFLIDAIPLKPAFAVVALGLSLYLVGFFTAWLSGLTLFSSQFFFESRGILAGVTGITVCLWAYYDGTAELMKSLRSQNDCFDISGNKYCDMMDRFEKIVTNLKGTLLVFVALVLSLFTYSVISYPRPPFRNASSYTVFDYYIFVVFALVLMMISISVWGLCAGFFYLRKLRKVPIFLDKISNLEPLMRLYLLYVVAYFFCVGLVYIAMPFLYAIFAVIFGNIMFIIPQIYFHEGIKLKKQEILRPLQDQYWRLIKELQETVRNGQGLESSQLKMHSLDSMINTIESIKKSREWVIDYSTAFKLLGSGAFVLVIKYVFFGSI